MYYISQLKIIYTTGISTSSWNVMKNVKQLKSKRSLYVNIY